MLNIRLIRNPLCIVLLLAIPPGCGGSDDPSADASVASDAASDGATAPIDGPKATDGGASDKDTSDAMAITGDAGTSPLTFFDDGVFRSGQSEAYLTNAILAPSNILTISSTLANNTGSIRIIVYQASGAIMPGTYACAPGTVQMTVSTVNPSRSFSAAQGTCSVVLSRVSGRAVGTFTGSLKAPLDSTAKVISNGQFDLPL